MCFSTIFLLADKTFIRYVGIKALGEQARSVYRFYIAENGWLRLIPHIKFRIDSDKPLTISNETSPESLRFPYKKEQLQF
jgi:hypothetical protein